MVWYSFIVKGRVWADEPDDGIRMINNRLSDHVSVKKTMKVSRIECGGVSEVEI